jgi:threonine/homoserine/homoserine lactone efflux protein
VPLDMFLALLLFAFVTSVTPGPNNLMLLASGVNFGLRRTVPHLLGVGLGFAVMVALVGLGLGRVLAAWPQAYTAMKVAGVAYLLWLAWKLAGAGAVRPEEGGGDAPRGRPMTFLGAAAFQWVNPKGWVMAVTSTATYSVPDRFTASALLVALVFGVVGLPASGSWAVFGVWLRRWLAEPRIVRVFNVSMAGLLVLSLWPLVAEGWR